MGRRAGQAPLTRQRILDAALRLIDADGLESLSMRRLGAELGVDPMAIYYHLPGKDAVIQAVVAHVFANMPRPPSIGAWDARARGWARTYRALAAAHPNLVLRIVGDPAAVEVASEHSGAALHAALEASGLAPRHAARVAGVLVDYINGFVLAEAAGASADFAESLHDSFEFGLDVILAGASQIVRRSQ
jgi:AcrR family transcriptional regulator